MTSRLVVVVPSIMDDFGPWEGLVGRLQALPGYGPAECHWELIRHGAKWHSRRSVLDVARHVAARINQRWVADGGYDDVVLVGHSLGGTLLRQAYVDDLAAKEPTWAAKVSRIVLFASINRGVALPRAAAVARWLPYVRHCLFHDLLRGSAFIANLRITWMREVNILDHPPLIVQFLGDRDGLVRDDDSSDIQQFPTGDQVIVPDAGHGDLIRLDLAPEPEQRFALVAKAFTRALKTAVVPEIGDNGRTVVIVLHGIRAGNTTWVRDIEDHISRTYPGVDVVAASYGRFSARKFIFPAMRRRFIGWLEDVYAERLALNPKATFHFIGHSNGTYLLGHGLATIPGMRFGRVLLAGSVLPTSYDWRARFERGQVGHVRNDRAARDIPVGVLCAALRGLGMRDVGTGGVDGFYAWDSDAKTEVYYYPGGHSAALAAENLPALAAYVLKGDTAAPAGLSRDVSAGFALLSRSSTPLAWLLLSGLAAAGVALVLLGPLAWPFNALILATVLLAAFLILDLV
ncbi:lipase family alpha/beta hydrolase [Dactylosporangium sp. CS-033363]|uniref:lipase family alpha/beta hydrolase n=1 Tax=Dactylosporangium sp. CS-033363 TaxID=3239935 RepID=UPI003D91E0D4